MTTVDLYKQLKLGKITESKFLYEVRRDNNLPFITNLTSFKDAEQILKNRSIIREWAKDDKEITAIIDKLNPYRFKKAIQFEIDKLANIDEPTYIKIREKVAKKMAADPMAYREAQFINSEDIEKQDQKLQWEEVKKNNFVDKYQQMKKVKGQEKLKAQKAPKTENRKGKPKGVKELTYKAKKAKGIKEVMPETKKEKIVENLFTDIFKKKVSLLEDTHYRFGIGQAVPLPEKDRKDFGCDSGTIKDIKGGTLYLELESADEQGQPIQISRQINVIEHELGGRQEIQKEPVKEPVINADGNQFKTGQEVMDEFGKKVRIDGFKKDKYGKIEALIKASTGMFYHTVNIDGLEPIKKEKTPQEDAFSKLPNLGKSGQNWLSGQGKLKELFNKLKEVSKQNLKEDRKKFKKIKKEVIDPQTIRAAQTGKTTLSVKKGSADEKQAQQKGLTYTSY